MAPTIVFDIIAGGLLTFGLYRQSRQYQAQMPLTRLIIRDGLLYFAVVFMSNIVWIVVHVLSLAKPVVSCSPAAVYYTIWRDNLDCVLVPPGFHANGNVSFQPGLLLQCILN